MKKTQSNRKASRQLPVERTSAIASETQMLRAIYYPHTGIQSPGLMKQALLLWDEIEYIAPDPYFRPHYSQMPKLGRDAQTPKQAKAMQQAMELIGQPYVPNEEEKQTAHETILAIADAGIPQRIANAKGMYFPEYAIYKNKLLPHTWEALHKLKLGEVKRYGDVDDFVVQTPFGLLMMAVLTDCCARTQSPKLTDRGPAYLSIAEALQRLQVLAPTRKAAKGTKTAKTITSVQQEQDRQAAEEYVVTTTLRIVDVEEITLADLIKLRSEENKQNGHWLTQMRRTYAGKVQEYTRQLLNVQTSEELKDLDRQLDASLELSLKELRSALKNTTISFLKKDLLTSVTAGSIGNAALLVASVPAPIAALIGILTLGAQFSDYRHKRNTTLANHPLGYLYATKAVTLY